VSALQALNGRAQRWVLWPCAARAVGVLDAGWSMGMIKALLGTREWVCGTMANWKVDIYSLACGIDLVFINELEEISGIDRGAGPCRHRPARLLMGVPYQLVNRLTAC
jgi:hypothetical protein